MCGEALGLTISDVGPGAEVLSLWAFALVGDETGACPHLTGAAGDRDAHTVELPIVRMSRNEPEDALVPELGRDPLGRRDGIGIGVNDFGEAASGIGQLPERGMVQRVVAVAIWHVDADRIDERFAGRMRSSSGIRRCLDGQWVRPGSEVERGCRRRSAAIGLSLESRSLPSEMTTIA